MRLLDLFRKTETEESPMTYGPQGDPVNVSQSTEDAAGAQSEEGDVNPTVAPLPGDTAVTVTDDDAPDAEWVQMEAALAEVRATLAAASSLVTKWSTIAETTLVRGDYEKGQRDATLTRSDELRKVLGI